MLNAKTSFALLMAVCLIATGVTGYLLGGINPELIQGWLKAAGIWAPVTYVAVYVVATILILPSTALNLTGGAIFGPWMGTFWTSVGAIIAAIAAFIFARTVGREIVAQRLAGRWQAIDAEVKQGAVFYMFAIRLMPILPYGLVNFAAGLTSISFQDYLIGTALGTVPGILPFVLLGSSGLKAIRTGEVLPLVGALALIGMLVGGSTWYRRRRSFPTRKKP
ncbi:DedA [Trichormus variabilis ATCC 29413]|uniref:TVP38/TMEM64 family membrane protein n=2 Tax=Anabaena variabilis TaxID=264691 RepID=Q3MAM3_TRIV2|nr:MULTISPECIES: TVP38/TMEM64 family protein [Nostocaceae]ABA21963.1 DedA [Trichormus variabilis ATCC 29413]MBC1215610.1 TVP38/TMEM64 family protein [Trichormus variabilis ARAD]MBC1254549.1 TVP38/TMEM64 family protein [Trichormus variabilis V5]MBC1267840.1 TVP38/TMEM64 family protein [Trichormus variabilis FSR]MBC1304199.1 TVP38/TMEM64 family protein [Trichormus variabilis N2B]